MPKKDFKQEVGKTQIIFKMLRINLFFIVALLGVISIMGCSDDEDSVATGMLNLNISGLEDLGSDYVYEGWIMVNGTPQSAGVFSVDGSGNLSKTSFEIDQDDLDNATAYILTIEPSPDSDPNPSSVHILAGDFSGTSAALTVGHSAAIGDDFSTAEGSYILATPTDGGMMTNENSGIWWLDPAAGPGAGLDLPALPAGWKYEGWVVMNGTPVTTGTFISVTSADDSAPFSSSTASGPPFPGEDFLLNAPSGLAFPTDLSETTAVISVEPDPDNSTAPFLLKPLVGTVPTNAVDHTSYSMNNNSAATNPTGTASR